MDEQCDEVPAKQSYRDLRVWQKACDLVTVLYQLTDTFPPAERYEVAKHMRKTAWSIPLNIAEGCARYRKLEYLHFLRIAIGSVAELDTFLIVTRRLGFGSDEYRVVADKLLATVGPMLHGLYHAIRKREED